MTKSFIKKIFSYSKSKEQESEQISTPDKSDIIEENEEIKNSQASMEVEKEKNQESTPTECDVPPSSLELHSDKTPLSGNVSPYGKIIVTNTIREKKSEETLPESFVEQKKTAWFGRLKKGLALSSQRLSGSISDLFVKRKLDEETLQELEDILIQADLGVETATHITNTLASSRYEKDLSPDDIHTIMADEIKKVLEPVAIPLELDLNHKPHVILLVGVNGTGKTTTIGKIAAKLTAGGLKVTLAAGDTFRAAAIEQLHIWGERTGSPV
ncbi:signal recognition particle receptor subunit alpha, partial [Bartonella saheliensis]|uniref:signal recognition particle receptor subunit alpha n=1 Tax=Bartonella saheliensis TaxID=1457016 RepID=UPI001AA0A60B